MNETKLQSGHTEHICKTFTENVFYLQHKGLVSLSNTKHLGNFARNRHLC